MVLEFCVEAESAVSGRPKEIRASSRSSLSVRSDDRLMTGWANCCMSCPNAEASRLATRCSSSLLPPALEWVRGSPFPLRETLIESNFTSNSQKSVGSLL